jgi:hypothetical protein
MMVGRAHRTISEQVSIYCHWMPVATAGYIVWLVLVVGSPDDDAFGFGMDPKGPTIAKQSYYHHRPCSRATDDTFMSTLQGTTVKVCVV